MVRKSRGLGTFLLLAQLGSSSVVGAATIGRRTTAEADPATDDAESSATNGSSPAKPSTPAPPPPAVRPSTPFRLALTYTRVLTEDGDLANDQLGTNALGLQFVSPSSTYVRNHFAIAHQWESAGAYRARGFRIDLASFGYPIRVVDTGEVRLDIEPIVNALRGEIMFVTDGGGKFLRLEGGIGLDLSVTFRRWFFTVEPLAIDFRYWFYGSRPFDPQSQTGLGRIFPLRLAIGHEF
jgi:hypothetical protein